MRGVFCEVVVFIVMFLEIVKRDKRDKFWLVLSFNKSFVL